MVLYICILFFILSILLGIYTWKLKSEITQDEFSSQDPISNQIILNPGEYYFILDNSGVYSAFDASAFNFRINITNKIPNNPSSESVIIDAQGFLPEDKYKIFQISIVEPFTELGYQVENDGFSSNYISGGIIEQADLEKFETIKRIRGINVFFFFSSLFIPAVYYGYKFYKGESRSYHIPKNEVDHNDILSAFIDGLYDFENNRFTNLNLSIELEPGEFIISTTRATYFIAEQQVPPNKIDIWGEVGQGTAILTNLRIKYFDLQNQIDFDLDDVIFSMKIQSGKLVKKNIGFLFETTKYKWIFRLDPQNYDRWASALEDMDSYESIVMDELKEAKNSYRDYMKMREIKKPRRTITNSGKLRSSKNKGGSISNIFPDWTLMSGADFEVFIADLLKKMGYEQVVNRPLVGDGGIDIEAVSRDRLTSLKIGVECKNHPNSSIGREIIQKLDSAIKYENFNKGIVITTGYFTENAKIYARDVDIDLIDRKQLEQLIQEYSMK